MEVQREWHWRTSEFNELGRDELYQMLCLRHQVFVVEQNCVYLDLDGLDTQAVHIQCLEDGRLLAYQRCLAPGISYPQSSIGRILVAPEARGLRLGRLLVQRGIDHNLSRWPGSGIRINAQAYLAAFYGSLGFVTDGEEEEEDGIMHVQMDYVAKA